MDFINTTVVTENKFRTQSSRIQTEMVVWIVFFTFLHTKYNKVFCSVAHLRCCNCTVNGRHLPLLHFVLLGRECSCSGSFCPFSSEMHCTEWRCNFTKSCCCNSSAFIHLHSSRESILFCSSRLPPFHSSAIFDFPTVRKQKEILHLDDNQQIK